LNRGSRAAFELRWARSICTAMEALSAPEPIIVASTNQLNLFE